jgi:acetolactate synthase-1/2/3 large subunit
VLVADHLAEWLATSGIRHVFGVSGANIEDLFAAVQRQRPRLRAVLAKHEHAAGTAADAYARLTGGLGVVMTTSGGGAMNVVHALAEARASRVPLLALIGEPPTDLQGQGAFQDTSGRGGAVDAAQVFRAVSVFCARPSGAAELPATLAAARAAALGPTPGPAVLLLAKDLQRAEAPGANQTRVDTRQLGAVAAVAEPAALERAARLLAGGPVLVIAGDEVPRAGAVDALARLVLALDARVAVAPEARDAFDAADPHFAGVAGAMGHAAVAPALAQARTCLVVGSRLPLLTRMGLEGALRGKPLVSLASEPPFVTSADGVHLGGDLRANLANLAKLLPAGGRVAQPAVGPPEPAPVPVFGAGSVARAVGRALPEGSILLVDAGNTGAQAVHEVRAPRGGGRWLLAMGMAGMGWSFGAAVGAACATGRRCTVLAGDGAFFMHGLDVHTAIEHQLPITYVIFNNRAHGMCLVRERMLLGSESGTNTFRPAHIGAGLAAMFPGLAACDCATLPDLEAALRNAADSDGPAVIGVELPDVEIPPFLALRPVASGGAR